MAYVNVKKDDIYFTLKMLILKTSMDVFFGELVCFNSASF